MPNPPGFIEVAQPLLAVRVRAVIERSVPTDILPEIAYLRFPLGTRSRAGAAPFVLLSALARGPKKSGAVFSPQGLTPAGF
jgi:hypothetical protein